MIVYPINWRDTGIPITIKRVEDMIVQILEEIQCPCLSLSGGLDSSLLLYFMTKIYKREDIRCFTIALNKDHPEYFYSNMIGRYFNIDNEIFIPFNHLNTPNEIVKLFYENLESRGIEKIIAGDGIDEFMGGYYPHQKDPSEITYYYFLNQLLVNHLKPLDQNSGNVKVILPYIDQRLVFLLSQIPLRDKVDLKERKKIMNKIAKGKIPDEIIERWKYGFCDAMRIKR